MKLVGQFAPATRSELVAGWSRSIVVVAFLVPWIAIAVGCLLAGIVAIHRGEYSLIVCLPAGLALLVLPPLLYYLDCRWYRRITGFVPEGKDFTYTVSREAVPIVDHPRTLVDHQPDASRQNEVLLDQIPRRGRHLRLQVAQ